MNEDKFLASLKALNSDSLEEFYENSIPPKERVGFQFTLLKLLVKNYSVTMVIHAFFIVLYTNLVALLFPEKKKQIPDFLTTKLPTKTWYQGHQGNCSVVAVIKAVQARYKKDIFKNVNKNLMGSYDITLMDEQEVSVTFEELDLIKKQAKFMGPDNKDKENAYLAFAVIVKNACLQDHFTSFISALNYFNDGSPPEYCVEMLGYVNCIMYTEIMRGLNDIIVAYSKTNAVCINHGFIEGMDSRLVFAGHDTMGKVLDKAFILI